jgi:glycosyltransferase involved in cell wall biosynthesis
MCSILGKRSVLIVAYYFPPWGGGPVLRTLKLVKYLQPLGWQVSVLTAEPRYYEALSYDPELLREVGPAVRLARTRSLQPAGSLARGLQAEAVGGPRTGPSVARLMMPLARRAHRLLVPDDKLLWIPFALYGGLQLVLELQPQVIYVTVPPHSTALLGLALSRIARRPLVLDIRDDWIGNPLYRRGWQVRSKIEARMERAVVRSASSVIVPTDASKGALASRYPDISDRIHVVPNGFDDQDIELAREVEPVDRAATNPDQLRCIYAGLVTARRDLVPLFQAIQRINRRAPGSVHLQIAGFLTREATEALASLGLDRDVTELGYLAHLKALRLIMHADVAVLVSTEGEGARTAVPSKLYEYVACGRFVLGLVDRGATRELIERHCWGMVCGSDDSAGIERALAELLDRKQAGSLGLTGEAIRNVDRYTRRAQAGVVSKLLDAAIDEDPTRAKM